MQMKIHFQFKEGRSFEAFVGESERIGGPVADFKLNFFVPLSTPELSFVHFEPFWKDTELLP
jgi:hypothetical protein